MNNAQRVRSGECAQYVAKDSDRLLARHLPGVHSLAQALAGNERHGVERQAIGHRAGREHRHDMRSLECGGEPNLASESLD